MAGRASAIITADPTPSQGQIINQIVGATTFYNYGFFGFTATVANIEAGYAWNGHETLQQLTTYISDPSITPQFDWHATAVTQVIAGSQPLASPLYYYQAGIAPYANIWSGAVATDFTSGGGFDISSASFTTPYVEAMLTGVNGQTADVINSSWGDASTPNGDNYLDLAIDALVAETGKTVCVSAGNSGPAANSVGSPALAFNVISVGSLGPDTGPTPFNTVSSFSSVGPNDAFRPSSADGSTGMTIPGGRAPVDIVAPGEGFVVAYYGGATGSMSGEASDPTGGAGNYYALGASGTSFASPVVAGGAALVVDFGKQIYFFDPKAIDGRVIKAVLLNSADKIPGWNNGQTLVNGVITTRQALDYSSGAGALDLNQAFTQYAGGEADILGQPTFARVLPTGWLFAHAGTGGTPNVYVISGAQSAGSTLTATLDWYATEHLDTATLNATYGSLDELDLEVWSTDASGLPKNLIAESIAQDNTVQHLYFQLPTDGDYLLEVVDDGPTWDVDGTPPTGDDFGLAWNITPVPEPAGLGILLAGMPMLLSRKRGKRH